MILQSPASISSLQQFRPGDSRGPQLAKEPVPEIPVEPHDPEILPDLPAQPLPDLSPEIPDDPSPEIAPNPNEPEINPSTFELSFGSSTRFIRRKK